MPFFVGNPSGVKTALGNPAFGPFDTKEEALRVASQLASADGSPVYEAKLVGNAKRGDASVTFEAARK